MRNSLWWCLLFFFFAVTAYSEDTVADIHSNFGYNHDLDRHYRLYLEDPYFKSAAGALWVQNQANLRYSNSGDKSGDMQITIGDNVLDTGKGDREGTYSVPLPQDSYTTTIHWFSDDPGYEIWPVTFERDDSGTDTGAPINYDQTPPGLSLSPSAKAVGTSNLLSPPAPDVNHDQWYTQFITANLVVTATDGGSGVASIEYQVDLSGVWIQASLTSGGTDNPSASTVLVMDFKIDGRHRIDVRTTDHVGNRSGVSTQMFCVDTTKPQWDSGTVGVSLGAGSGQSYQTLTVSWPALTDPLVNGSASGFKSYTVYVRGSSATTITNILTRTYTFSVPGYPFDRSGDNGVELHVIATDNAGNTATVAYAGTNQTYTLPKQISIKVNTTAVLQTGTVVTLPLNITPDEFTKNYSQFTVHRSGTPGMGTDLTADVLITNANDPHLSTYVNGDDQKTYLQYVETIGALQGIGGKSDGKGHARAVTYAVATEAALGQPIEAGGTPQTFPLPMHPGKMIVQIVDFAGNVMDIGSDGSVVTEGKPLSVDGSGRVLVRFRGQGIDQDDWTVGVHEIIPQTRDGFTYYIDMPLGGAENAAMTYPYDSKKYDLTQQLYQSKAVPITLSFGDNNIRLQWVQSADPSALQYSGFMDLDFELDLYGRFSLGVSTSDSPTVRRSDSGAIVVSPGQPLQFKLSGTHGEVLDGVQWDFGDSTNQPDPSLALAVGSSVTHVYGQAAGQTTDSANYTISVSNLPTGTPPAHLPLIVQDTRDGALYTNEIWNGPHVITGNVTVPADKKLEIGTVAPTSVTFQGGLEASPDQGIAVKGELYVGTSEAQAAHPTGPPVPIGPDISDPSPSGLRWGSILVSGTAVVDNATISGAERGITAGLGSLVTLNGTTFTGNRTGLHAVSGTTVVTGGTFSGNKAYGVKEEAGGRPLMKGNKFQNNGVDYYQDGAAGISMAELNALSSGNPLIQNSGNQ